MSSSEHSYDSQVKEEHHSSDDELNGSNNQIHDFPGYSFGDIQYITDHTTRLRSPGSEGSPSDSAHIPEAPGTDQQSSDDETSHDRSRSPRKRRAFSSTKNENDEERPSKRTKGTLTQAYLDLLNIDIQDAATQYIPDDERMALPASQIGLISWTSAEKEIFFEALGRLGRDNVPGIAGRIRTKGVMEVRQYMKLLDDAVSQRQQHKELQSLELVDFPAAVEIGQDCSAMLEKAGDSLARRQEKHEEAFERQKWGDEFLLTAENCDELGEDDGEDEEDIQSDLFTLFDLPIWLKLSESVFMNSADDENNWQSVSGELPSIRLTALEDFYSLVVSVTTRLMTSASYIAESRIRSKKELYPTRTKKLVKRKDMEAAIASLGLKSTRTDFWGKCPRRLGLEVYEERPRRKDAVGKAIPYDEVEQELGVKDDESSTHAEWDDSSISSDSSTHETVEGDDEDLEEEMNTSWDSQDEEIKEEAKEVLLHSAVDRPQTTRERQALISRIKAEREQEVHADAVDAYATYKEEKQMWNIQGKEPSEPIERPTVPESSRRSMASVGDVYSVGQDWRHNLHYVSQWEYDIGLRSSTG